MSAAIPTGGIWVVAQHERGVVHRGTLEVAAFAQDLASKTGATLSLVVVGGAEARGVADELSRIDVAGVLLATAENLAFYDPAPWTDILARAYDRYRPEILLFPHTYQTVDFMARLAQRVNGALIPEVIGFAGGSLGEVRWRRPILRGKMHAEVRVKQGALPLLASVQAGVTAADDLRAGRAAVETLALDGPVAAPSRRSVRIESSSSTASDLSSAPVVVAVGRGVGDPERLGPVRDLASVLGGELGASRPVVDAGWLPRELQIGSSGQTVAPRLYVAIGISGAIQHLVGMRGSRCVVAINKDSSAPIFQIARFGIVGDLHEVVPALTRALRQRRDSG